MEVKMVKGANRNRFGGNSGRRDSTPRTHGGSKAGGPGKNAKHGDSSNHSQKAKGNKPVKGKR
jgi:hypothetical protein